MKTLNTNPAEKLTKGERTREKIIKSAIQCLAKLGYEKTTFQAIADQCGISQPLVVHYFEKRENVFPSIIEYLLRHTQDVVRERIDPNASPTVRLQEFIRLSLENVRNEADEAKVLLTLSLFATFDHQYRLYNGQFKRYVIQELAEIIESGVERGEFSIQDSKLTAKMLMSYIMGIRMNMLNEKPVFPDSKIIQTAQEQCLAILRATSEASQNDN
jgi:AcrR family transcriptional regulator